jgi:hypothetical protein
MGGKLVNSKSVGGCSEPTSHRTIDQRFDLMANGIGGWLV